MLGKWYKNCLRLSELLDVNGRHLGFTFLIDRMTEVLTPDIYRAHCYEYKYDIRHFRAKLCVVS
jgi:hypothetical protein